MEKLSSGYRVNRAADDAAGLAISEKMRAQIGGLAQAQRNAQDGISLVQTAEGSLNEVHSMLQRMRDLKVQYKNEVLDDDDKAAIVAEAKALTSEIKDIQSKTEFNGVSLHNASGTVTFQVGANATDTIDVSTTDLTGASGVGSKVSAVADKTSWEAVDISDIDDAIKNVSSIRGDVRRRPEPPRAPPQQPRDLPGEPGGVREPDPRRGHGLGDGQLHQAGDPAAGRHEHARAGQPGAAERPRAPPLVPRRAGAGRPARPRDLERTSSPPDRVFKSDAPGR
jgi:flagellin